MKEAKTIMVIEDEQFLRETICKVLEEAGHKAIGMSDGAEAIAYLSNSKTKPDVILLDLMMPGMDGWQFRETQLLVSDTALIPVVVMTSSRDLKNIKADEVLFKPFEVDGLLEVIERQIGEALDVARETSQADQREADPNGAQFVDPESALTSDPDQFLMDQVAEMEQTVQMHEKFLGIVCHDLRNPLNAITMAASHLSRKAKTEELSVPLGRILRSARQMQRMISQLLDFTRTRVGQGLSLNIENFDLSDLVREAVSELQSAYDGEIRVLSEGDNLGAWDRDRLWQLVSNMVGNACQHGEANSPVIVTIDGTASDVVRIVVKNSGAIPKTLLPIILDPMRRALEDDPKKTGSHGIGLGLYVSRQIALAHGGKLAVDSSEATGTQVTAVLPRAVVPEASGSIEALADQVGY